MATQRHLFIFIAFLFISGGLVYLLVFLYQPDVIYPSFFLNQKRTDELFSMINLDYPGLEKIKGLLQKGDRENAKKYLVEYYKLRNQPKWPFDINDKAKQPEFIEDEEKDYKKEAQKILEREFNFLKKMAKLSAVIDWNANPLGDFEWTAELNNHFFWRYLGRAYWETGDEKYANDFVMQLRSWLTQNPVMDNSLEVKYPWKNPLRSAARLDGSWVYAFLYFSDSPNFTIDDRISMLYSIGKQAEYLAGTSHQGNALIAEMTSLFNVSIIFPEFKEAKKWQDLAIERLNQELNSNVYPDGAQVELSSHYHMVALRSFIKAYNLASQHSISFPDGFVDKLEKMFEYVTYVAKPDLRLPMLNDSDYDEFDIKQWLAIGVKMFFRKDMEFVASQGKNGQPPLKTSYAFPYAGFYIMRSGWDINSRYLLFEAGPYGLFHQHEDKLQVDVYAYGRPLLMDPGRYTYESGSWRNYFLNTESHNTVMVDGYGQQRKNTDEALWITGLPLDNLWISNPVFDLAVGSYADGYGTIENIVHIRQVLFVKNDYWIISDRFFEKEPSGNHGFSSQFQFSAPGATIDVSDKVAKSNNADANLLIVPVNKEKFSVNNFEGQTNPPRGWIGWSYHKNLKTPASQIVYNWREITPARADFILAPYSGKISPKIIAGSLSGYGDDATALEIKSDKGRDVVIIQFGKNQSGDLAKDVLGVQAQVMRYDSGGQLIASKVIKNIYQKNDSIIESLRIDTVDNHTVKINWESKETLKVFVDYGYSFGGGYIFQTQKMVNADKKGEVIIGNLTSGLPYSYRLVAVNQSGQEFLAKEGAFKP